MAKAYDREPFAEFMQRFRWRQGEHMLIIADTQCGKTSLASILAARRSHVVVLGSKPRDDNLKRRYADYFRTGTWPAPREEKRVLLWPKNQKELSQNIITQRHEVKKCLDSVGGSGGWCVVVDEAHWTSQFLKLDKEIAVLHHQGASSGITMLVISQRPAWIPRIVYSSATHVFLGRFDNPEDLRALSSMGGLDKDDVKFTMQGLGRHDLLYLNRRDDIQPAIINIRK